MRFNAEKKDDAEGTVEKIDSAAILYHGEIFQGANHGEALDKVIEKYPDAQKADDSGHGFVTSEGRFVDREEALNISDAAGQTETDRSSGKGVLLS